MKLTVGVVGAGIVGLSTAINIQTLIKHVEVTVLADNFGVDTLPAAAAHQAGMFMPVPSRIKGVDPVTVSEWLIDSYTHHNLMAGSPMGAESGQQFMPGVCFYTDTSGHQNVPMPDLVRNFHVLSEEERSFKNYIWENVCTFETVVVDQIKYLRWLMKEFRDNGGIIKFRTVNALQELYGLFDVIVNCTGRRVREMVVDPYFTLARSRTVQLQKEMRKKFVLDDNFCLLPHIGEHLWDISWSRGPREPDIILDDTNAKLLMHLSKAKIPQLEGCEYVTEWLEHCRSREPPLVEIEMIRCVRGKGPLLPVVHNVGHGNEIITLAWGTGAHAAHLVQDCQRLVKPFVPIWRPFDPTS